MQEIFDREHDDFTYAEHSHTGSKDGGGSGGDVQKSCRHCGSDIPSESVICPECGSWWTNSAS